MLLLRDGDPGSCGLAPLHPLGQLGVPLDVGVSGGVPLGRIDSRSRVGGRRRRSGNWRRRLRRVVDLRLGLDLGWRLGLDVSLRLSLEFGFSLGGECRRAIGSGLGGDLGLEVRFWIGDGFGFDWRGWRGQGRNRGRVRVSVDVEGRRGWCPTRGWWRSRWNRRSRRWRHPIIKRP